MKTFKDIILNEMVGGLAVDQRNRLRVSGNSRKNDKGRYPTVTIPLKNLTQEYIDGVSNADLRQKYNVSIGQTEKGQLFYGDAEDIEKYLENFGVFIDIV